MRFFLLLLVAALSGLTLFGGALVFAAEMRARPGNIVLGQLRGGETPDESALQALMASRERELAVLRDPTSLGELALARLLLAEPHGARRAKELARAETLLIEALGEAPARPYLWARLALIRELQEAPAAAVIRPLDLSILTGPNIAKLALLRIELAFRHLPELTATQREALDQQIWLAWRHQPEALVEMAEINGQLSLVEGVITARGGDQKRFLRLQIQPARP